MKNVYLFLLPLLFIACDQQNNEGQGNKKSLGEFDQLMTEGSETDPGSRLFFEWMRRKDPVTGMIPPNMRRREMEFAKNLPANYNKAFNWDQRGPWNVGGRTRAIGIDVLDENTWLMGAVTGGIWRSVNAGLSWTKVTDDMDAHSITSIVQDTRAGHENVWYAGTGESYGVNSQTSFEALYSGDGVLKSTDNGVTWSPLVSTQSNTPTTYLQNGDMDFVWRLVIDPTDLSNDVVLAAVYNGVYRSADGGGTWSQVLGFTTGGFSSPACQNLDLVVSSTGVFYCTMSSDGPGKGVYRSEDGVNWVNITPGTFPNTYGRLTMAINPLDENVIWMFGSANSGHANSHGVYRYQYLSGDGSGTGGAWSDRSANLPDQSCSTPGITTDLAELSTQSSFDVHIGIHPTDTAVIYIAGTSIWRNKDAFTHDSSNTWMGGYRCDTISIDSVAFDYQYKNHHPDQHYITFLPSNPDVMINTNDGGLYVTVNNLADTVEWISLNNGYLTTQHYAVMIEPGIATSDIVFGGMQDNGTWWTKYAAADSLWKRIGLGDGMYGAVSNGLDYYITCKQRGRMYLKEIDADGNVLAQERLDPEGGPSTYNWANSLKIDPNNDNVLYWNGRTNIWRLDSLRDVALTYDMQNKHVEHWVKMDSSKIAPGAGLITDIEVCETAPGTIWYGCSNPYVYRLENTYADDTVSVNKFDISSPDWPAGAYVSCIAVNPFDADQIIVTFANYNVPSIWWTSDGGQTWEDVSGNLEENADGTGDGPAVFWAEYYVDGTVFIGTSTGLYTSGFLDNTNTVWTLEPGIGNVPVDHMDFRTHDGYFAVGTHGLGIFTTRLTPGFLTLKEKQQEVLTVYPTLATDIVNVIAEEKAKMVEVYNLSGQRVYQAPINGNHQINVSGLNAGTYIVLVRSDQQKWTSKFVKH